MSMVRVPLIDNKKGACAPASPSGVALRPPGSVLQLQATALSTALNFTLKVTRIATVHLAKCAAAVAPDVYQFHFAKISQCFS